MVKLPAGMTTISGHSGQSRNTVPGARPEVDTEDDGGFGVGLEVGGAVVRPLGVVLAALLFGALHAGAPLMQAQTSTPVDIVEVLQALIVMFVAAPPLVRAIYRLRATRASGVEGLTGRGLA